MLLAMPSPPRPSRRFLLRLGGAVLVAATLATGAAGAATASGKPTLTTSTPTVKSGADVTFNYSTPPSMLSSKNWVGIYEPGQVPGDVSSTTWQYAPDGSGSLTFSTGGLAAGDYEAYYLYDDGYQVLAGPVDFKVVGTAPSGATLTGSASTVGNGASITFTYSTPASTLSSTNWVGIYEPGQVPGEVGSTTYQYTPAPSGRVTFSTASLDGVGEYVAYYFYDNGYQVLAGPVRFDVVGEQPRHAPSAVRVMAPSGKYALDDPFGVAVAPDRSIWVADTGGDRIERFTLGHPDARLVAGRGELDRPEGIAATPSGNIWVADTGNDRLVEFSPSGSVLVTVGGPGTSGGQFEAPTALVVSRDGDVYVADRDNNRVEKFSPKGVYLSSIPVPTPAGVALNSSGDLWVSSPSYADGNAVYEFSPAGTELTAFGATQASYGALSNTAGIAVWSGHVFVVQPDYSLVTVFNRDGSFYTEFGLSRSECPRAVNLEFPQGIAIDPSGHIWVADSGNNRLVQYHPLTSRSSATASSSLRPRQAASPSSQFPSTQPRTPSTRNEVTK